MKTSTSLLRRVLNLEADSWRRFHDMYRPLLVSYLRRQGVADSNIEDLVQDILLKLLRAFGWTADTEADKKEPGFQLAKLRAHECKFRTWLYTVTANALRDWKEKQGRRAAASLDHDPVAPEPEDRAWVQIYRQRVLDAVCAELRPQVEEKTWTCFAEHILKNRPCAEVAAALGVKPNTVSQNARRVLLKVIQLAREEYEEELSDGSSDHRVS
jgi:RNA polymerase sigma factor (sigma-70 family)